MKKFRTGDVVVVMSGKGKGKSGRVLQVSPADGRVVVQVPNVGKVRMSSVAIRDAKTGKLESHGVRRLGRSSVTGKDVLEPYPKKGGKNLNTVRAAVRDVVGGEH